MPRRIPTQQQAATAAKINRIRAIARGISAEALAELPCPTCVRPAHDPYRRIVEGQIAEGCIDAHHHGRTCAGGSTDWHMRPSAAAHRAKEGRELEALAVDALR